MSRWYVVHTQTRKEALAAQHLGNQGFETFLPRYGKRRRHARRSELVLAPLFPRYLFVRIHTGHQRWRSINGTVGVSSLLSDGERPLAVPVGIVEAIRERQQEHGAIATDLPRYSKGQTLRIIDGPFADLSGLFEDVADETRVVLLLKLLGRDVKTRLPFVSVIAA